MSSYAAALDHLHALTQELQAPNPAAGAAHPAAPAPRRKFDLDHMRVLAHALGDPQLKFPSILIAGTNGKGSTAATLASILAAAGLRTGLYTSPHLTQVTERIRTTPTTPTTPTPPPQSVILSDPDRAQRVEGESKDPEELRPATTARPFPPPSPSPLAEIPEPTFARLYFQVDDAARDLVASGQLPHHPSFFEALTALAFLYFAEQQLDLAVLEVGMGGRLDATNIVTPILSVITDIALDHQDYLGTTLTAIAREKAGILRAGGTLITLPQHPEANQAIGEAALALNVHAINAATYLPDRTSPEPRTSNLEPGPLRPNHYDLHLGPETLHVRSPLAGSHQQRNLALAIAAALELRKHLEPRTSNPVPNEAIEAGIAQTSWPGRLEFLPPNLLLDVAHNPAGAWTLRAALSTLPDTQPRTLLFSCLRDKDLREISQILFPLFDSPTPPPPLEPGTSNLEPRPSPQPHHLILTTIPNPRAASLADLEAAARALDIPALTAPTPAEALALARAVTPPNGLIVATGSIYLIGALRDLALTP